MDAHPASNRKGVSWLLGFPRIGTNHFFRLAGSNNCGQPGIAYNQSDAHAFLRETDGADHCPGLGAGNPSLLTCVGIEMLMKLIGDSCDYIPWLQDRLHPAYKESRAMVPWAICERLDLFGDPGRDMAAIHTHLGDQEVLSTTKSPLLIVQITSGPGIGTKPEWGDPV